MTVIGTHVFTALNGCGNPWIHLQGDEDTGVDATKEDVLAAKESFRLVVGRMLKHVSKLVDSALHDPDKDSVVMK